MRSPWGPCKLRRSRHQLRRDPVLTCLRERACTNGWQTRDVRCNPCAILFSGFVQGSVMAGQRHGQALVWCTPA